MCLKKENIMGGIIKDSQFEVLIQQIVVWIFEIEHIKKLMKIDEKIFYDVFLLFFTNDVAKIIDKFSKDILLDFPPELSPEIIKSIGKKRK